MNCYTVFAWEFDFFNTVAVDRHCQSTVTHGKPYTQQSILRLSCSQNTPFPQLFMDWLRNTTKQNHHKYFWGDCFYILANTGVQIQLSISNYLISTANFPGAPYVDNAKRQNNNYLLYKHQINSRSAFTRKRDIFTCGNNMYLSMRNDHHYYGYIINHAFQQTKIH